MTVGLVLSGGAVRGAAHVGVLRVLEREGLEVDMVVGTSVGALVGAGHAAGLSAEDISKLFRTLRWPRLARVALGRSLALLDSRPMEEVVVRELGKDTFEELAIPFAAVACDVVSGDEVVLRSGPLGPALRASAAVPGIFRPVEMGERLLVDGGVVDNFPVRVARSMGAEFVVGVDLLPRPSGHRRPRNAIELMSMAGFLWSRSNHPDPATVDCLIVPEVADVLGWDFADVPELERLGMAAAERVLPILDRHMAGRRGGAP